MTGDTGRERAGPMLDPPHPGELVRESMDEIGWNATEAAARPGCTRGTLSRLPNGRAGLSVKMAPALEDFGWRTPDHWIRMQASHELAQAGGSHERREKPTGPHTAILPVQTGV